MNTIEQILDFLRGKKSSIATISSALIVFSLGRGFIAQDTAGLLSAILVALGLSVNYVEAKVQGVRMFGSFKK